MVKLPANHNWKRTFMERAYTSGRLDRTEIVLGEFIARQELATAYVLARQRTRHRGRLLWSRFIWYLIGAFLGPILGSLTIPLFHF